MAGKSSPISSRAARYDQSHRRVVGLKDAWLVRFVGVPDGQPPMEALLAQQLNGVVARERILRAKEIASVGSIAGVVAKRVSVSHRRRQRSIAAARFRPC